VYRAEDIRLGRDVAVKFLPDQLASDAVALERFRREARAASRINHPHICTVHDIGEDEQGHLFLVMELLGGETLKYRLQRGAIPSAELLEWSAKLPTRSMSRTTRNHTSGHQTRQYFHDCTRAGEDSRVRSGNGGSGPSRKRRNGTTGIQNSCRRFSDQPRSRRMSGLLRTRDHPSAWSKSQIKSSTSSKPIDRRTSSGVTPAACCSAMPSCWCVVDAG
jgi:hypothetical protein